MASPWHEQSQKGTSKRATADNENDETGGQYEFSISVAQVEDHAGVPVPQSPTVARLVITHGEHARDDRQPKRNHPVSIVIC